MKRKKNIIDDIELCMRLEEASDDAIIAMIQEKVQNRAKLIMCGGWLNQLPLCGSIISPELANKA